MKANLARREFLTAAAGIAGGVAMPRLARAADALPVNIANTQGGNALVLEEMIKRLGYLVQFGVTAKTVNILGTPKLVDAISKDIDDICLYSGFGPVLVAIEKGAPVRIVAGSNLKPQEAIFAKSPDIKRVKQLEGKKVGVGEKGALLHQIMVAALKKAGADPAKVDFVNVGNSDQVIDAISAGVVDAGPSESSFIDTQDKHGVHVLDDGRLWDSVPLFTNQASYASSAAIADPAKREALVRTLAAHAKLYRYLQDPKSWDVYVASWKAAVKFPEEEARTQWNFYQAHKPFAEDLLISGERVSYLQQLNVDMGLQSKVLPFDQMADLSLAKEAVKRLG